MDPSAHLADRLGQVVFDRAPCLVALIDANHRLVRSNGAFQRLFGHREGEACHAVYKQRANRCDQCSAAQSFADGSARISEHRGISLDNRTVSYRVQDIPLRDEQGEVQYVLQIAMDTTRVTELEGDLRQAESLATVGLTTAGLAHTVKNILGGLDGATYAMDTGFERHDEDRLKAGWQMVREYLAQIASLVGNLLQYAKPRQAERQAVDPADLVQSVVGLYRDKAALANIELQSSVDEGTPLLWLDRTVMEASLANLVTNAIDACTWDPDTDKAHFVRVRALPKERGGVVFEVQDSGMGISEENQRKAMDASFTTKGIRGTGLGLLLTKKAVQENGGTIEFVSTPGAGTTFSIEIPVNVTEGAGDEQDSTRGRR